MVFGCVCWPRPPVLEAPGAHAKVGGFDPLVLHTTAQLDLSPEEPLVRADGLVEVGDGECDVMDGTDVHAPILSGESGARTRPGR